MATATAQPWTWDGRVLTVLGVLTMGGSIDAWDAWHRLPGITLAVAVLGCGLTVRGFIVWMGALGVKP